MNLQYLIKHPDKLNEYRKSSLKPEKEFEELIKKNRSKRTKEENELYAEYENRILRSISETYHVANMSPDEKIPKLDTMRDRMDDIGLSDLYIPYGSDSHSIHGDWVDTEKYFLKKENERYYPNFDDYEVDIRQLNSITIVCYESLIYFLNNYPDHGITDIMVEDLEKDMRIIMTLEQWHQNFLNQRPLTDKKL